MNRELLQIISAGFAGIGFAMIFHIRPKHLPVAFIGGALSWVFYLGAEKIWESHMSYSCCSLSWRRWS